MEVGISPSTFPCSSCTALFELNKVVDTVKAVLRWLAVIIYSILLFVRSGRLIRVIIFEPAS